MTYEGETVYDNDQYLNEEQIEALLDDDEISLEEAGFLQGYNEA
ncbi:MAG TPA: hypothetical protein VJC07_00280 [Candidatus Nanoarchaeia archaeon]|nr:hypothetical protein [Candidatus Nanoarchaeia archaeon]